MGHDGRSIMWARARNRATTAPATTTPTATPAQGTARRGAAALRSASVATPLATPVDGVAGVAGKTGLVTPAGPPRPRDYSALVARPPLGRLAKAGRNRRQHRRRRVGSGAALGEFCGPLREQRATW